MDFKELPCNISQTGLGFNIPILTRKTHHPGSAIIFGLWKLIKNLIPGIQELPQVVLWGLEASNSSFGGDITYF